MSCFSGRLSALIGIFAAFKVVCVGTKDRKLGVLRIGICACTKDRITLQAEFELFNGRTADYLRNRARPWSNSSSSAGFAMQLRNCVPISLVTVSTLSRVVFFEQNLLPPQSAQIRTLAASRRAESFKMFPTGM